MIFGFEILTIDHRIVLSGPQILIKSMFDKFRSSYHEDKFSRKSDSAASGE